MEPDFGLPPGFKVDFAYRLSSSNYCVCAKREDEVHFFIFDDVSTVPTQMHWYKMIPIDDEGNRLIKPL